MLAYFQNRPLYLFDGFAGADEQCRKKFRVVNELASECLFIRNLLIRPTAEELAQYGEPDFTILVARASSVTPRSTARTRRRPSSSTTNRGPSSSPARVMPGKSRRASFPS